jgi:hypothetical protein
MTDAAILCNPSITDWRDKGRLTMQGILEPVLLGGAIVFLISLAGAYIEFNNRLVNAVVDAVLFVIVFGLIAHFAHIGVVTAATPAAAPAAATSNP